MEELVLVNLIIDHNVDRFNLKQQLQLVERCMKRLEPLMGGMKLRSPESMVLNYKELVRTFYQAQKSMGPLIRE